MKYVLVGINHNTAPIEVREKVNLNLDQAGSLLDSLLRSPDIDEATVISTCNRVEVYGLAENEDRALETCQNLLTKPLNGSAGKFVYRKAGGDVVSHLFNVTSSLDSQVTGENQITGQVKEAFQLARQKSATGYYLNKLFDRALFVAKRVKTETEVGRGNVSIGSVGVMLAKKIFGKLHDKNVLLIGAGEIGELVVRYLNNEKINRVTIVNRTFERAVQLETLGLGSAHPYDDLTNLLADADVVICSISAEIDQLRLEQVRALMQSRNNRPLFVIDLGLPRNVNPEVGEIDNFYLYNIDDLKGIAEEGKGNRQTSIEEAKNIIDQEVKLFYENYLDFEALPAIAQLGRKFETVRQIELQKTLQRLEHLSDKDKKAIDKLTQVLVNRVLHEPILSLRNEKELAQPSVVAIFKRLFRLDDEEL